MPAAPAPRAAAPSVATRWLDPDEMKAWRSYVDTINDLQNVLEADVAPFGLTMGDYEVLARLSEPAERQMRMCDLANQLQLSPSGLTRRLDGLVKHGLVNRHPSASDRRVMLAVLTDDGLAVLERAAPFHVTGVRRHFIDLFSATEIRALGTAFTKVRAALAAHHASAS